jgi:FAD/FMN-containing dehydrogenase
MDYEDLKQKLKGELLVEKKDITPYSTDASIFSIMPSAVVRPLDSSDISTLVNYAREHKKANPELSLTVRAGGTDMTGGSINNSFIIDVAAHLNRIEEIGADFAIAQPGVWYRDFEASTLARGLLMPAYPASKLICALGGMVGNNAGGERSLSYGQVKDFVTGLWVVLADGKEYYIEPLDENGLQAKLALKNFEGDLYRAVYKLISEHYDAIKLAKPSTSKNSSGYFLWDVWDKKTGKFDLTQLIVGSQGTLGIITKIKFRLIKPKRSSGLLVISLPDLAQVGNIVNTVKNYNPGSFELYDKSTLDLALTYLPEIFRKMKGNRLKLAFSLIPDIFRKLTGRLPQIILFAEFTGDSPAEVEAQLQRAHDEIQRLYKVTPKIALNFEAAQKYWTIRRESYNILRMHNVGKIAACFIEDIIVHPDQLPEFMPRLYEIFAKYPSFVYTIAGHAGDANFHIMPLMDFKNPDQRNVIIELANQVFDLVKEFNGSMSAEHNDGIVRGSFLAKMYSPEICDLFRQTKAIFDPDHIFNPHKKIEATAEFFTQSLKAG